MRTAIVLLAVVTVLSACATKPSQVSAVDGAYVNRLNGRIAQYNQTASELDASLKERFDAAPTTVQQASASPNAARESANLARDVVLTAEWHARSATLNRFMGEAAVSGQLGLMYSWLQNQLTEVVRPIEGHRHGRGRL